MWWAWLVTAVILESGEVEREAHKLGSHPARAACEGFARDTNQKLKSTPGAANAAALVVCKEEQ